jgi:hypothetical protein
MSGDSPPHGSFSIPTAALVFAAVAAMVPAPGTISRVEARDVARESALKAAYLFNFIQFVEWPPFAATEDFTICFLENGAVYERLSAGLPDKRLGGHRVLARRLARGDAPTDCEVLYVDSEKLRAGGPAVEMRKLALLTVSDAEGFLKEGGIIELFAEGNRLRFRISLDNAKRNNLRISSGLLQLASEVLKEG